jgi:Na+-translocating ferredoxin:NAD+ oxidoreductase RnfG subunit
LKVNFKILMADTAAFARPLSGAADRLRAGTARRGRRGPAAAALLGLAIVVIAAPTRAQEAVFLSEEEAPRAVFPEAAHFERLTAEATDELRAGIAERLGGARPSVWEDRYVVFRALRDGSVLGHAFIVEEIGKHRPITFVVGLRPDGSVQDVAVMAYREPYGGEVRNSRFLVQYRGRRPGDRLRTYHEIVNIAGATLSVDAASRAVKKAQALQGALFDGTGSSGGSGS